MTMGKYQYSTCSEMYNNCHAGEHEGYAIIGRERFKRGTCMLPDVTTSREAAEKLVDLMNNNQVDLCQMRDVAEDLIDIIGNN